MAVEKYEIVIGCEIHTQLLTKTKAFCACENKYGGMPNTRVCPVCLGLPGAMPRISKGYVELGAVAGMALNCNIARFTKFDRKHYFYPDLTKGYQITQYDIPLCIDGHVDLPLSHYSKDEQEGGAKFRPNNFKGENCIVENEGKNTAVCALSVFTLKKTLVSLCTCLENILTLTTTALELLLSKL